MKYFLIPILLIGLSVQSFGQIVFEATPELAFQKAKKLGKPVMIECYHPNCPVCMALEPTLKKAEVGEFYNKNYVSYKLNLSDANQVKFLDARKLYLPSFPTMLFFDNNETLLHAGEPQNSVEGLVSLGTMALAPDLQAYSSLVKFKKGEALAIEKLVSLGQYSRIVKDTTLNHQIGNKLFEIYPKDKINTEESWLITSKCITDIYNGFASYWFDNVGVASMYSKAAGHENAEQNVLGGMIQGVLYGPKAKSMTLADIDFLKAQMTKLGLTQYIETATWQNVVYAAVNDNKPEIGKNLLTSLLEKFKENAQSLIFIGRFLNDFNTNVYLVEAKKALSLALPKLPANDFANKAEYYFEVARASLLEGNKAAAKTNADTALKNAQLAKVDIKKFNELIAATR